MKQFYMQQAIDIAWRYQLLTYPNPAVGACVVQDDTILSVEAHQIAGGPHAEVNAIKAAYLKLFPNSPLQNLETSFEIHHYLIDNHNGCFENCEIFVTLEPCNHLGKTPACANLLKELRFKKVTIGTLDSNNLASGGKETLQKSGIKVETGVLQGKCDDLLFPFIQWHINGRFRFFKLAIRADGSCDGGYITTKESLTLVHQIRTKLDLLIIGGNTVRVDRPTLDSRLVQGGKAPDILIYSKAKKFDKSIPLFDIPNRKVTISENLEKIDTRFSMVEGGWQLFENLKDLIDCLVLFVSYKENPTLELNLPLFSFKEIYSYPINEYDVIYFYKKIKL